MPDASPLIENQLLTALPADVYQNLLPHLEKVTLTRSQVLYEAGDPINDVYFPHRARLSIISKLRNGHSIDVGMVGGEGMASTSVFMG